jgi:hypothetical protein
MPPKKRKKPLGLGRSSAHAKRLKARQQTEEGQAENAAESLQHTIFTLRAKIKHKNGYQQVGRASRGGLRKEIQKEIQLQGVCGTRARSSVIMQGSITVLLCQQFVRSQEKELRNRRDVIGCVTAMKMRLRTLLRIAVRAS